MNGTASSRRGRRSRFFGRDVSHAKPGFNDEGKRKMRARPMNNTEMFCLTQIAKHQWTTAREMAKRKWPTSKQIEKKTVTLRQHIERLRRAGFILAINDRYFLSDCGTDAAGMASRKERPLVLSLA
jgi:hypothetical protein